MASAPPFAYHCFECAGGFNPSAGAILGSFGDKLRKQREQRGLELDAISNTTKISPRMLRALEEEHFDQLPGGVFNKGFVRAYARQVGMDEEEAISDYLVALRESQIQQQAILPDFRASAGKAGNVAPQPVVPDHRITGSSPVEPAKESFRGKARKGQDSQKYQNDEINEFSKEAQHQGGLRQKEGRRQREDRRDRDAEAFPNQGFITGPEFPAQTAEPPAPVPWGKLAAVLVLIALLFGFWNLRRHRGLAAAAQPAVGTTQTSIPAVAAPAPTSASASSMTVGKASSSGTLSTGTLSPGAVSAETNSAKPALASPGAPASPKAAAASSPPPSSTAANKPAAIPASEAADSSFVKKTSTPALKPPPTFTLLIRAEKTTWVSIVADGKPVAEETLIAPAHTSIRASHEIYVRAGNAAGISFLLNGKEFPVQGSDGEVKTYVFDATGLQAGPQPAPAGANR